MDKKKTSKKRKAFTVADMKEVDVKVKTFPHDPNENLRDPKFIIKALGECLVEHDIKAFKDILKAHYRVVDLDKTLKKAHLSKRTFFHALSDKGNPSIDTVSKIMSALK